MRHVLLGGLGGFENRRPSAGCEPEAGRRTQIRLGGPGCAGASLISGGFLRRLRGGARSRRSRPLVRVARGFRSLPIEAIEPGRVGAAGGAALGRRFVSGRSHAAPERAGSTGQGREDRGPRVRIGRRRPGGGAMDATGELRERTQLRCGGKREEARPSSARASHSPASSRARARTPSTPSSGSCAPRRSATSAVRSSSSRPTSRSRRAGRSSPPTSWSRSISAATSARPSASAASSS